MRRHEFMTEFGQDLAAHWQKQYPELAAKLRNIEQVADKEADKAARIFSDLRTLGVPSDKAYEVATAECWDHILHRKHEQEPGRKPANSQLPAKAQKAGQA